MPQSARIHKLYDVLPRDEPRVWTDREFTAHGRVSAVAGYFAGVVTWLLVQGIARLVESLL